jgi:hypothetical protein
MPSLAGLQEQRSALEPVTKPLDEAAWQAWLAKNRAQEQRRNAARVKAVKWVSAVTLLAAAGLGSDVAPYSVFVRFVVALGAIIVMFDALHSRHYAFTILFGTLAVLYNPLAPVFSLSGGWQRALVVATVVPFVASLAWRNARKVHHDYRCDIGSYRGPVSG